MSPFITIVVVIGAVVEIIGCTVVTLDEATVVVIGDGGLVVILPF